MLFVIAVVCPPLAVLLADTSKQALINIVLTICGWVPGVIHAFIVIKKGKTRFDDLHTTKDKSDSNPSYSLPKMK